MVDIKIKNPGRRISYNDQVLVIGSCFTEHIGGRLAGLKFNVLQNPNGILFDPLSVSRSLLSYIEPKVYRSEELFNLNELWQSWQHHSMFSGLALEAAIKKINASQQHAHEFLHRTDLLIITLGSAFYYELVATGEPVANCHRAPAQWFQKKLGTIEQMKESLEECIRRLFTLKPSLHVLLTVSPVRHIREGVVENNRSKSRLIEVVHYLAEKYEKVDYFPAYELVIDVLRDYRFYDIDLVHPNYAATEFVFEKFVDTYMNAETKMMMAEVKKIMTAYRHKPFHAASTAHQDFLKTYQNKIQQFQLTNPQIDWKEEAAYFSGSNE